MSEFRLKVLWFLEKGTMKGFPKLGKITQDDIEWAKREIDRLF